MRRVLWKVVSTVSESAWVLLSGPHLESIPPFCRYSSILVRSSGSTRWLLKAREVLLLKSLLFLSWLFSIFLALSLSYSTYFLVPPSVLITLLSLVFYPLTKLSLISGCSVDSAYSLDMFLRSGFRFFNLGDFTSDSSLFPGDFDLMSSCMVMVRLEIVPGGILVLRL